MKTSWVVAVVLVACSPAPEPEPPPGPDASYCPAACERFRELGCPEGDDEAGEDGVLGTEDDVSCEEVCEVAAAWLNPEEMADIDSCDEIPH
jgi:hypothetical protein